MNLSWGKSWQRKLVSATLSIMESGLEAGVGVILRLAVGAACEMVWAFSPYGDWVPRVTIPQREAQVEITSPLVNQPWKSHSFTFAIFRWSRPPQKSVQLEDEENESLPPDGEVVRFCQSR